MTETPPTKDKISIGYALELVWDVGFAIAIPTVLFALGGRWLDGRLHSSPVFLIIGLLLSLVVVGVLVIRKGREIAKRL